MRHYRPGRRKVAGPFLFAGTGDGRPSEGQRVEACGAVAFAATKVFHAGDETGGGKLRCRAAGHEIGEFFLNTAVVGGVSGHGRSHGWAFPGAQA